MTIESLYHNKPETLKPEQISQTADELVILQQIRGRLVLDKTGEIPETTLTSLLDRISQNSIENHYFARDKRPIRFWVNHLDASELYSLNRGDTLEPFLTKLAQFVASVPQYAKRALKEIDNPEAQLRTSKGTNDPIEAFNQLFRQKLEYKSTIRKSMQIRELLKMFANPPSYSEEYSGKRIQETDPDYPMLIPIFNIRFNNLTQNPQASLDDFNHRFNQRGEEIWKGKIKATDIFNKDELSFAHQCGALVGFTDGLYYSTFDLPRTDYIIAVPLFPYEAIRRRYGYTYEGWLGFGPNDELYDAVRSMSPLKV
jgi:hypothetical protein